jgi:hypothetical protein
MSILKNLSAAFVPVRERREASGSLAAANAELALDVNGDNHATIWFDGSGATFNATYVIEGTIDGTNYGALLAYPITTLCNAGTIPLAAQPIVSEAVNTTSVRRALCVAVAGLKRVRIRLSAWTAGSATAIIISDTNEPLNPYVKLQKSATLMGTVTAATGVAATLTLASVAGLRHYIDRIQIVRSATALLTAAATPVTVTTTNIPGSPIFTFGADAGAQGADKEQNYDFGGAGIAATAIATNTTIVAPATTGVIWRINASYRLGL